VTGRSGDRRQRALSLRANRKPLDQGLTELARCTLHPLRRGRACLTKHMLSGTTLGLAKRRGPSNPEAGLRNTEMIGETTRFTAASVVPEAWGFSQCDPYTRHPGRDYSYSRLRV
jgi:hypothetical protein